MKRRLSLFLAFLLLLAVVLPATADGTPKVFSSGTALWEPVATDLPPLGSMVWGNGRYAGLNGCGHFCWDARVVTSTDLSQWTATEVTGTRNVRGLAFAAGHFVLLHEGPPFISLDGITWKAVEAAPALDALVMAAEAVIAVGGNTVFKSADLLEWTAIAHLPEGTEVESLLWDGVRFVAGASLPGKGTVTFTSTDALDWQGPFDTGTTYGAKHLALVGGRYLVAGGMEAMGGAHSLAISDDGAHWSVVKESAGGELTALVAGDHRAFVTIDGQVFASEDGLSWSLESEITHLNYIDRVDEQWAGLWLGWRDGAGLHRMGPPLGLEMAECSYSDVKLLTPLCRAVVTLKDQGIISGYPDGSFGPNRLLTRAEVAKLLTMAMGLPETSRPTPFTDTSGHWVQGQGYLQRAYAAGLISGFPDGTFRPDAPVTRAEIVKMVVAAYLEPSQGSMTPYRDVPEDAWFGPWVGGAQRLLGAFGTNETLPLWGGDTLSPEAPTTRGEAIILLYNAQQVHELMCGNETSREYYPGICD